MKIAIQIQQNGIFGYMCEKVKELTPYHKSRKLHYECNKIPFWGICPKGLQKLLWYRL